MDFKVNANNHVKVKLTAFGEEVLRQNHKKWDERVKAMNRKGIGPFELITDKDGYYVTQMWHLMDLFGHVMQMGNEVPFDLNIIVTGGEPIY